MTADQIGKDKKQPEENPDSYDWIDAPDSLEKKPMPRLYLTTGIIGGIVLWYSNRTVLILSVTGSLSTVFALSTSLSNLDVKLKVAFGHLILALLCIGLGFTLSLTLFSRHIEKLEKRESFSKDDFYDFNKIILLYSSMIGITFLLAILYQLVGNTWLKPTDILVSSEHVPSYKQTILYSLMVFFSSIGIGAFWFMIPGTHTTALTGAFKRLLLNLHGSKEDTPDALVGLYGVILSFFILTAIFSSNDESAISFSLFVFLVSTLALIRWKYVKKENRIQLMQTYRDHLLSVCCQLKEDRDVLKKMEEVKPERRIVLFLFIFLSLSSLFFLFNTY